MRGAWRWIRESALHRQAQGRFPRSVLHHGAEVGPESALAEHTVLFRDTRVAMSTIGAFTYVQEGSRVYNAEVGPFCSIAAAVTIGLAIHPMHMASTSPVFYDDTQPLPRFLVHGRTHVGELLPRTTIGADVWIGQGALIKAGLSIGVGAVIGAGAVVTKDVAPYSIVGGNPGRLIRMRFDEPTCERLLASSWWMYDIPTLERLAPLFAHPNALVDAIRAERNINR